MTQVGSPVQRRKQRLPLPGIKNKIELSRKINRYPSSASKPGQRILCERYQMKIAFLVHSFGRFGGREVQSAFWVDELNSRGHRSDLYHGGAIFSEKLVTKLGTHYKPLPLGFKQLRKTVRLMIELRKYDRIVNMGCEPFLSLAILLFFGPKTVLYACSPPEVEWAEKITHMDYRTLSKTFTQTVSMFYGKLGKRLVQNRLTYQISKLLVSMAERLALLRYKSLLSVSNFSARQIESSYHLSPGRVRTMYQLVRPDLLATSNGYPISPSEEHILAVGALVPEKNFALLLKAAAQLPDCPRIVIAGEGPDNQSLRQLAKESGVNLSITLADDTAGLAKLYSEAFFVVQPSLYECLSMVPIEAALFGKTSLIANSRHSGNSEVTIDGETGFTIPTGDPEALAKKMAFLLSNPSQRSSMGTRARASMVTTFRPEARITALMQALSFETNS